MSSKVTNTRKHSDHFMVGQECPDLGVDARRGKLPLTKSVMQYLFHRKNLPKFKYKSVKLAICCPMKTGLKTASCDTNPDCKEGEECVVRKIKTDGSWHSSGIAILSDFAIAHKISTLNDEFKNLDKNKKCPNKDLKKREDFQKKLESLFDISSPKAVDIINKDRLRDLKDKEEDITFLDDQRDLTKRKMVVGGRDKNYDKSVHQKEQRLSRAGRMMEAGSSYSDTKEDTVDVNQNLIVEDSEDNDDEDFVVNGRKKKSSTITLTVSKKRLAQETSITAKRHKVGITAQRDLLANIINVGGGDVENFSLSRETVRRAGATAVKDTANNVKNNFVKLVEESFGGRKVLIVHFDGKSQAQFHDQVKAVKKRLSVIVSSPDLDTDQVLGVPITSSNSGKHQLEVVSKVLEDWRIKPFIFGLGFDTTSDNTGRKNGAVVLIEKFLGEPVFWVACPHHFYEIHVKKVARLYFGETSNPEETTYKKLKDNWNKVVEATIDYENLELFNWRKWRGKFIAQQAEWVKNYLLTLMAKNTFPREDSKELMNLVLVWLGVKVNQFKFQYPGAMSHARFLMQSIYSMKIVLLSKQITIYSKEELDEIKQVAFFVGLFHCAWYFKCSLACSAPMLHLSTVLQMKRLEKFLPELSAAVLGSINLHLWYLTPQAIVLALVDESLSNDLRSSLAVDLSSIPRSRNLPLGKPVFPDLSSYPKKNWISGCLPDLSTFLGPQSWLIFNKLGLDEEDMMWLEQDPKVWELQAGYIRFRDFVRGLTIVNDPAERGVGLMKQFIASYQNEESFQANLIAVSDHRKIVGKNSKKSDLSKVGVSSI